MQELSMDGAHGLTDEHFGAIRVLSGIGTSNCEIARMMNCHPSTIARALAPGAVLPSQRQKRQPSKRYKALRAKRQQRAAKLVLTVKRDTKTLVRKSSTLTRVVVTMPFGSPARVARQMATENFENVSRSTVRRDLIASGIKAYRRGRNPLLTAKCRKNRVAFATAQLARIRREPRFLSGLLFSDEKWFNTDDNGVGWQWAKERDDVVPRSTELHPTKIIMFGCIGIGFKMLTILAKPVRDPALPPVRLGRRPKDAPPQAPQPRLKKSPSVTSKSYIAECMTPLKVAAERHFKDNSWTLMQDGAAAHKAGATRDWQKENKIDVLQKWPAHSPDLNPIETLWALLARKVADRGPIAEADLTIFLREEWEKIPQATVDRLVRSYESKLRACKEAQGGPLKQ
jgi:Transposase/DDE superfamily endonuclease